MGLLINDGFTLDAAVEVRPYPAVKIKYRPALPEAVDEYLQDVAAGAKQRAAAAVKLLADHLVSWGVLDESGNPAAVTAALLKRVPHPVRQKMIDLVTGYDVGADLKN